MSVEKTFHCYNGHAFALIACRSDGLRGWAVGHCGINVYLVAAGITRRAAQASCLLRTINQARLPVARRLEACATSDNKRCSLSFSNRVPLPDEDRSNFAARLSHQIRCCRFLNLLPHDCGSLGSTGRAEPTAGYSHARSKTFSRRRLIATSRNSLKGGRELSGKNLRHPASA